MLTVQDRLRHPLAGAFARESIPYCIFLPKEGLMVLIYSWVDGSDVGGYAVSVFDAGPEPAYMRRVEGIPAAGMDFDAWDLGGVQVAVGGDFGSAHVRYADNEIEVDAEFTALHDAFDYDSNEAGCPAYQATNRYEQGGQFRGTMRWRGRTIAIDGPGHRDHSWGRRDWDAIHHYKWLAIAGTDRAVNLMIALVEGEVIYNGYLYLDGVLSPIRDGQVETVYDDAFLQRGLDVVIRDEAGRTSRMALPDRFASARWDISPTMNFSDGVFAGELEGGPVSGYVQYVWPKSYLKHILTRDSAPVALPH